MDYIIDRLHAFAITKDTGKFNNFVDNFLRVDHSQIVEKEITWDLLKKNYSNLKYIHELLNHYDYSFNDNFYILLNKFVENIYVTTRTYLRSLTWDDSDTELTDSFSYIEKRLRKSIKIDDFNKKIKQIIKAYNTLVPILEDFLKEKYQFHVEEEFRNMFSPKRLKMQ